MKTRLVFSGSHVRRGGKIREYLQISLRIRHIKKIHIVRNYSSFIVHSLVLQLPQFCMKLFGSLHCARFTVYLLVHIASAHTNTLMKTWEQDMQSSSGPNLWMSLFWKCNDMSLQLVFGREHIRDLVCATWMFRLCIVAVVFISYVLASLLAVNFPSQPRIKFQLPLDLLEESHSSAYKQASHLHILFPRRLNCCKDSSCDANTVCFTQRCFQISACELRS